jgi:hypothetical protein
MELLARMGDKQRDRFFRDCDRACLRGVIVVYRTAAGCIRTAPVVEFSNAKSLQRPLTRALERKAKALGKAKAKKYVTMLAIDVEREDARDYLADGVRIPDLPPTIDHLWLFVRSADGSLEAAFHAARTREQRRLQRLPV